MAKPNFLIVGAARSGTTSLYEYLRRHPEVFMPKFKEPGFFITKPAYGLENNIEKPEEYEALFSSVRDEKAVGEASTAYLYDPHVPKRIADYLGSETRIIILLRNPVDMAYSLWGLNVKNGYEGLPFLEAVKAAEERLRDEDFIRSCINKTWIHNYAYIDRARYSVQVDRFIQTFGRENVRVYIFEDFFRNHRDSYGNVCRFLSVSDDFYPQFKKYNPASTVRSEFIRRACNERMAWKEPLKLIMPKALRERVKVMLYKMNIKESSLPELSLEERRYLSGFFQEDIAEMEVILGAPLQELWQ